MTTPSVIASACFARGSSCSGANQIASGTSTQSARPHRTTDIGGRSSKAAAGALSVIVSVVKQACLAEDIVEYFFASGIQWHERKPNFRRSEQTEPRHHVLQRNRIRVEENRLRQSEQLEVKPASFVPLSARGGIAQLYDTLGIE